MQKVNTIVFLFVLLFGFSIAPTQATACDVDSDGDVDRDDINLIFAARNTPASGPEDPRDADGNGTINVLDGRQCVLQCTLPNCASENIQPEADAGPDQRVEVGDTVQLDGSGSSDLDGDPLTFMWSLVSMPPGSTTVISDDTSVMPTFVADVEGEYVVELIVNDGTEDSAPDTVTINTENTPPVAEAGPNQTVAAGATVELDGSGSSDVDGDSLTFLWSLTTAPPGSTATLSDPTAVMPTFVADLPGEYVAQLIVNDGTEDSDSDTVMITTLPDNAVPVADAGMDQTVEVGDTVTLDGSGSSDLDEDPLTFKWSFTSTPSGSSAVLSDDTSEMPTFVADVEGRYVVQLIVNDGLVDSAPDTVVITTAPENTKPVAIAGNNQTVAVGDTVQLDGSDSFDVDNDPLTFSWSFTSLPSGSTAALSDPTSDMPTFVADTEGDYVAQLIVNDGLEDSVPDTVTITAEELPQDTLTCGALVSGSIVEEGEVDLFTFSGTAGDVVALTITGSQMGAKVFEPSGAALTGFFFGTQTLLTLPESGTYVVEIAGSFFTSTGNYNLGLECLAPVSPDAVALNCGSLVSGSIETGSEKDLFTFSGTAGDVIALTITGSQMGAKVFEPSGAALTGFFFGTQTLLTLPESGTYVVEVAGSFFTSTGNYNLGLECLAPVSPDAVALNCGSLVSGSIETGSEKDLFTFSGTAGDVIALTITGSQMGAKVFEPSGAALTGFFFGTQTLLTLPESGTYVVEVAGSFFTSTGNYNLGLECLAPVSPDAVALNCGSLVSGSIETGSEKDLFTFSGTAGDVIALTITGSQMGAKVFEPSGAALTGFFFGTQTLLTLPESGTYVVEVAGSFFTSTGNYNLGLECI